MHRYWTPLCRPDNDTAPDTLPLGINRLGASGHICSMAARTGQSLFGTWTGQLLRSPLTGQLLPAWITAEVDSSTAGRAAPAGGMIVMKDTVSVAVKSRAVRADFTGVPFEDLSQLDFEEYYQRQVLN